ncbi:unnamed protein product [Caenorhabditis nigoni]
MKELVWSDAVAQEVSVIRFKDLEDTEERFFAWLQTYEEDFNQLLSETSKMRRNPDPDTKVETAHYLFPLFEKIGCNTSREMDQKLCYFSPGFPKELLDARAYLKIESLFLDSGEAGSKCDNDYENDDGLCKIIMPTTSTVSTTTVTTTTKKQTPKTSTAPISVPNQDVNEDSGNDVPNEPSSSYSMFSIVHILEVLGFGYSFFHLI